MKINLSESLYGLGGLFHAVGHDIDAIEEEVQDEEIPNIENIQIHVDMILKNLKPITIGDKYIPYGLLWDYILAIKHVEQVASYKNLDLIKKVDYERQYRHLTILAFAQEERKSEWDDMLSEKVEEIMGDFE